MDDGSSSIEESKAMLNLLLNQGIDTVYLTPHFYISENQIEDFLSRREGCFRALKEAHGEKFPKLKLGAETYYFEGMTTEENIEKLKLLKLEDTDYLLLEMPFTKWTKRMVDDVIKLQNAAGITVLMAHIERYLGLVDKETLFYLKRLGVVFQMNAEYINQGLFQIKAKKLLNSGLISIIASDTHNLTNRKPNMDLLKKLGK